jgi:hypothetical protein
VKLRSVARAEGSRRSRRFGGTLWGVVPPGGICGAVLVSQAATSQTYGGLSLRAFLRSPCSD